MSILDDSVPVRARVKGLGLIMPFLGGKRQLLPEILPILPPHRTYVEGFGGGAAVFFSKPEAARSVLNDKDSGLYKFYRGFSCKKVEKCKDIRNVCAFAIGAKKRVLRKGGSGDVCDQIAARRFSIVSDVPAGLKSRECKIQPIVTRKLDENCPKYAARLKRATVTHLDYRDVVKKYDAPDTLFFLDPPYPGTTPPTKLKPEQAPPESVCELARRVKGKVIITYMDTPRTRNACAGLYMKRVESKHAAAHVTKTSAKRFELLISNFPLTER
jgi:DNA adenine methylase